MTLLNLILQAPAGGAQWQSFVMIGLIFVVFYFFMIRPQSKKQKEIAKFREALKSGDKIITAGGLHGKIKEISPDKSYAIVEITDQTSVRIEKSSIFQTAQDTQAK